jgi:hypothetical protein
VLTRSHTDPGHFWQIPLAELHQILHYVFMNTSQERWIARRRGRSVIIRGLVACPREAKAIFDPIPEPNATTRSFRFYFNPPDTHVPPEHRIMSWVEHVEPHVPDHVRRLRIALPSGETVTINSQQGE